MLNSAISPWPVEHSRQKQKKKKQKREPFSSRRVLIFSPGGFYLNASKICAKRKSPICLLEKFRDERKKEAIPRNVACRFAKMRGRLGKKFQRPNETESKRVRCLGVYVARVRTSVYQTADSTQIIKTNSYLFSVGIQKNVRLI